MGPKFKASKPSPPPQVATAIDPAVQAQQAAAMAQEQGRFNRQATILTGNQQDVPQGKKTLLG